MSQSKRDFKNQVYGELGRVGKAVASPRRIELLDLLAQAPRSVANLAEEAGLSVANTSQHLQTLREAKLVETERAGNRVIYRLAGPEVADFVVGLRRLAEGRLAELEAAEDAFFGDSDEVAEGDELWERVRNGEVRVLDVRPEREYQAGHIDGATSVPVDELEERLDELTDDLKAGERDSDTQPVVVYCRGPYCTFAGEAVAQLRERGVEAVRLREGYPEWRRQKAEE